MRVARSITAVAVFITLTTGLLISPSASGQWSDDPTARTPVATAEYRQYFPRLVAVNDGFVVTWRDQRRYNTHVDLYAQKFNGNGTMLWPQNGRVMAAGPENKLVHPMQFSEGLLPDGSGGAIAAWNDTNNSTYFQTFVSRISKDATVAWGSPGVPIQAPDTAVPMLASPTLGANRIRDDWGIAGDSENGAFIPLITGLGRLDSTGRLRTNWFYNSADQRDESLALVPVVSATGKDGVIVVWNQPNTGFSQGVRARKLLDPESLWPVSRDTFTDSWGQLVVYQPPNTITLCDVRAVPDGAGGAIAVWTDGRIVTDQRYFRIYAQRIDSAGQVLWARESVEVSGDVQTYTCHWWSQLVAVADAAGGAVVAWNDSQGAVRAQRIKADGSMQWQAGGRVLITDADFTHVTTNALIRATDGNFIVLYHRGSVDLLVAQKLNAADGSPMWGDGKVVFEGCFSPYNAHVAPMVSDGQGGAVVAWEACDGNLYAHRVTGADATTYSVGGSVSNLTGNGLVLQINSTDTLAIAANGPFTFAKKLANGSTYSVRVATQPTAQTCRVTNGNGTISNADVTNIAVSCVDGTLPPFQMNAGLNDAWYDPSTSGQGFFITVFPDLGAVTLAWFTYDTELPPPGATANLGDPGHRWLTALGAIDGNQALMDIEMTSGGLFDTYTEITRTDPPGSDGTLLLTFDDCNSGTVEYDIPSINQQGIVPIQRVANDNIAICEALAED